MRNWLSHGIIVLGFMLNGILTSAKADVASKHYQSASLLIFFGQKNNYFQRKP